MRHFEAIVIGAGPAGLAIATALARHGAHTALVSPQWPPPWPNTFGLWRDEIPSLPELAALASHRFEAPLVCLARETRSLNRTYLRLDNEPVRDHLTRAFIEAGGELLTGQVAALRHQADHALVELRHEDTLTPTRATLVIDATGTSPAFTRRAAPDRPGYQAAHGVRAVIRDAPRGWGDEGMRLMDWRPPAGGERERALLQGWRDTPSFLYMMRLSESEVFVEETSLVARPALAIETLRDRLHARLATEGVRLEAPLELERCLIPMGNALPDLSQRTLAWGGAASMVHPATGYQVAKSLERADEVGAALSELARDTRHDAERRAALAWEVIWPHALRQRRQLYLYGMELMMQMDAARLDDFFHAFFALPEPLWQGYLSDTLPQGELMEAMWRLFARLDTSMRARLVVPALTSSQRRRELLGGVLGLERLMSRARR